MTTWGMRPMALAFLPLVFLATSFGPGWLVVRRLRMSPNEKIVSAVGASYLLVFLAAFTIYLLKLPAAAHYTIGAASVLASAIAAPDLFRVLQRKTVRR